MKKSSLFLFFAWILMLLGANIDYVLNFSWIKLLIEIILLIGAYTFLQNHITEKVLELTISPFVLEKAKGKFD